VGRRGGGGWGVAARGVGGGTLSRSPMQQTDRPTSDKIYLFETSRKGNSYKYCIQKVVTICMPISSRFYAHKNLILSKDLSNKMFNYFQLVSRLLP